MKNKNEYSTRDLFEASLLFASAKKLIRLDREDKFFWFVFDDNVGCDVLITAYWSKEASIDARTYADAIRSLKDRLFALRGGRR